MNVDVSPYLGMYNNNSAPGIILKIPTFTVSSPYSTENCVCVGYPAQMKSTQKI